MADIWVFFIILNNLLRFQVHKASNIKTWALFYCLAWGIGHDFWIFGRLFLENEQRSHNAKCDDMHVRKWASSRNWHFGRENSVEKQQELVWIQPIFELFKQLSSFFLLKTLIGRHLEVRVERKFARTGTVPNRTGAGEFFFTPTSRRRTFAFFIILNSLLRF